jgi:transmembrane sensor
MEAQKKWELLSKYLAGECTEAETKEVEAWVKSSAENKAQLKQYKEIWTASEKDIAPEPDTAKMWSSILSRIEAGPVVKPTVHPVNIKPIAAGDGRVVPIWRQYRKLVAILLAIFLLAVSAYMVSGSYRGKSAELVERVTGTDQKTEFLLADGTHVWLNENSKLHYPVTFDDTIRTVYLEGEAFFDVAQNKQQPFKILAGKAVTQVLGTSFNVKALPKESEVSVTVISGKVALSDVANTSNSLLLEKGEKGIFDRNEAKMIKEKNNDPNFLAWQTGVLGFRNASLSSLNAVLEQYYKVDIIVADQAVNDCRVTATFDNLSLDEVLEVLKLTLDISYTRKGNKIIIGGEGC